MAYKIPYPKELRKYIADLDLLVETGRISPVVYAETLEHAVSLHEVALKDQIGAGVRDHAARVWVQSYVQLPVLPPLPTVKDKTGNVLVAIPSDKAGRE